MHCICIMGRAACAVWRAASAPIAPIAPTVACTRPWPCPGTPNTPAPCFLCMYRDYLQRNSSN